MIEVKNLAIQYNDKQIFNNVKLSFQDGQIYSLVGPSGSGKTTLLNTIAKLQDFQDGQIIFDGVDLQDIKTHTYFRNHLGYLFQNYGLIDNQSVFENLDLGFIEKNIENKKEIMIDALKIVNLDDSYLERKAFSLSGGEAQRVALARLFIKRPKIILADEPTAALDVDNSQVIIEGLKELAKAGSIVIIATHDPLVYQQTDIVVDVSRLNSRS